MNDIKLWKTSFQSSGAFSPELLKEAHGSEIDFGFEEILVQYPKLIREDLRLVCGKIDTNIGYSQLLGVNRKGRLVILALEKGTLTSSSVSRIIEYAAYLYEMTTEDFAGHVKSGSGTVGIKKMNDFLEWYQTIFQTPFSMPQSPKMILIGADYNHQARRMGQFLFDNSMDISLLLIRIFPDQDEYVIATQKLKFNGEPRTDASAEYQEQKEANAPPSLESETTLEDLINPKSGGFF